MLARQIAEGSYGIQTEKKYDDEIGDLTDAINEMSAKISQSEKMQTEFISSVSHELRTPLTAISGYAELLENGMVAPGDEGMFISRIRRYMSLKEEKGRATHIRTRSATR